MAGELGIGMRVKMRRGDGKWFVLGYYGKGVHTYIDSFEYSVVKTGTH